MREIEFRGKLKDTGEWIYGGYTKPEFPVTEYAVIWESWEGGAGFGSHVIPETVGQYTGLKDNNGVKIFEGDIVLYPYRGKKIISQILYLLGSFCVFGEICISIHNITSNRLEVIGNIHDNPKFWEEAQ